MKALSIRQPWAWAILHGGKDVENRDWPARFRGPILIHASKSMGRQEYEDAAYSIKMAQFSNGETQYVPEFEALPRGGIVGQMEIVDCVKESASPWFLGHYGFVIQNAKPLPFTPIKGALGLFDVPDHLVPKARHP